MARVRYLGKYYPNFMNLPKNQIYVNVPLIKNFKIDEKEYMSFMKVSFKEHFSSKFCQLSSCSVQKQEFFSKQLLPAEVTRFFFLETNENKQEEQIFPLKLYPIYSNPLL